MEIDMEGQKRPFPTLLLKMKGNMSFMRIARCVRTQRIRSMDPPADGADFEKKFHIKLANAAKLDRRPNLSREECGWLDGALGQEVGTFWRTQLTDDRFLNPEIREYYERQIALPPTDGRWAEFRNSGLLWWINRILHTLGWSIAVEVNIAGEVVGAYPIRTKWLGFNDATNEKRLAQFREGLTP
jgi:hypothetical protein